MDNKKYDFYLASPFFNEKQVERMESVLSILRLNGNSVFAPYENSVVENQNLQVPEYRARIFAKNVNAIKASRMVLAITNDKDMGTLFEAGYAHGLNIPVVYFAEDLNGPFNLMLSESGIGVYTNMTDLMEAVQKGDFTSKAEVIPE